jgi:hypothetical protein
MQKSQMFAANIETTELQAIVIASSSPGSITNPLGKVAVHLLVLDHPGQSMKFSER